MLLGKTNEDRTKSRKAPLQGSFVIEPTLWCSNHEIKYISNHMHGYKLQFTSDKLREAVLKGVVA